MAYDSGKVDVSGATRCQRATFTQSPSAARGALVSDREMECRN